MSDLVVTWPKSRAYASYLVELANAVREMKCINYRVAVAPDPRKLGPEGDRRLYRVHDGLVRGYTNIKELTHRGERQVERVASDPIQGYWPAGFYIVCYSVWHDIATPISMPGFRGFRYIERPR